MDAVMNALICVLLVLIVLVLWRWRWLRTERRKLTQSSDAFVERFDPEHYEDERDQTYHGRVIKRLRSRVIEGRVEVHWEYQPEFVHRGFVLTAKCRRNDGDWQPLALEPYQDSGSWIECFNHGESRSYLFTVKKSYRFFFGLLGEAADEIVYDQISFSVRKGKFMKERAESLKDRNNVHEELIKYLKTGEEIRQIMNPRADSKPAISAPETKIDKLEKQRKAEVEIAEYIERETAKINAQPGWSEQRKAEEIRRLNEMVTEAALED